MKVSEIFHSLQGEGLLTGVPSVFIRFAGCNLRCAWCDTRHASWNARGREMSLAQVLKAVTAFPARHAVITGGEPLLAPGARALARALHRRGLHVTIETNGTQPPRGIYADLASLSPKLSHSAPDPRRFPAAARRHTPARRLRPDILRRWLDGYSCQLKFVVRGAGDAAEIHALLEAVGRPIPPDRILLMPEGNDRAAVRRHSAIAVELCRRHGYRYGRRLHIELFGKRRGV